MIKVENMVSPKTGRAVPNQFIIRDNGKVIFQSYETIIALIEDGTIYIDKYCCEYSRTTTKYLIEFVNKETGGQFGKTEILKKMPAGGYHFKTLSISKRISL